VQAGSPLILSFGEDEHGSLTKRHWNANLVEKVDEIKRGCSIETASFLFYSDNL
jgi:hypothetical protein